MTGALPPSRGPVLQGAYLRGFPAFVVATYLHRQDFAGWLRGLADVHPGYRAELAQVLAELQLAAEQFRDWRASDFGIAEPAVAEPAARSSHEINVREAADMLRLSDRRVRQLCAAGALEARRVGSVWLIDVASVRMRGVA